MKRELVMCALVQGLVCVGGAARTASAVSIAPAFAGDYSLTELGSVPGLPIPYGGLTLLAGDTDTLLIGGAANSPEGLLYSIGVTRDAGDHITGFTGTATVFAEAAYNDGGVAYGPGGVLFTSRWPENELGQVKPGSAVTDKIVDLGALGVAVSHSAVGFVPGDYPGAGKMKLAVWDTGEWYTAEFSPDGMGTFDIDSVTHETTLPGGPEGFIWVPLGSPGFPGFNMLVSEWSAGSVAAYEVDADGNPIVGTREDFITDLVGAEGAFIDPLTGDFLFSTFASVDGINQVIVVEGFVPPPPVDGIPEPLTAGLGLIGLGVMTARVTARRTAR